MNFDKIDYILAVAEEKNLTRASQKLFISQPALTVYLNKLEDSLGVRLFDRSRSPIQLTKAGEIYLTEMKKMQVLEQEMLGKLHMLQTQQEQFRIGIGVVRGRLWLPEIVSGLLKANPKLEIIIEQGGEDQLMKWLRQGRVDVAIGVVGTNGTGVEQVELARERMVFAIPKALLAQYGDIPEDNAPTHPMGIAPCLLQGMPFLFPERNNATYRDVTRILEHFGVLPGRVITCGNQDTMLRLAQKGLGVQYASCALFAPADRSQWETLVFAQLQHHEITRVSSICYLSNTPKKHWVTHTIDVIRQMVLPLYPDIPC